MAKVDTQDLRNVVLLSHGGAGKTMLAEAMLFASGAINRLGKTDDGNTTSDYEPRSRRGPPASRHLCSHAHGRDAR